jgi:peptidoglycan/xylan/chitin deacetylase (PgdA/CDA1 family)
MRTRPPALLAGLSVPLALWACGGSTPAPGPAASPAPASRGGPAPGGPAPLAQEVADVVDAYRKIIVLLENERALEPEMQRRANVVGRILFQENHQRLAALTTRLTDDALQPAATPLTLAFLDALETGADLHDADKLAFRDVVDELADSLRAARNPARAALLTRIEDDQKALREIESLYEKELTKIFGRFETRGMTVRREAWENYVAFLKMRYRPEKILAEYEERARSIASPKRPVGGDALEVNGSHLPAKALVLTFDDGPHPRYTDRILETLKRFKVKAVFFAVGQNLGALTKDGRVQPVRTSDASRRLLDAGFPLANHSFSHSFLPKLTDVEIAREIELTNRMIQEVSKSDTILFRPPYGARDERVLAALQARRMKSILWNIDSKDWADPVPKSIANRAIATVEGEGKGILLFHDIQGRTVEALPMVLETLQSRGYRFLTWNGSAFVDEAPPEPKTAQAAPRPTLYRESWAVVVGIDEYKSWPRLQYAVSDARAVRELLVGKYQFKPENVTLLLNQDATREKILAALGDRLADGEKVQKDDRVFVFFAGHGITRKLPNGRSLGYIVPVEADTANYQSQAISMTNFQDVSEAIPAKHVFYVMDACYSGVALTRGGAPAVGQNYLAEVTRRVVRQMLTAGGADEQVADNGPGGHSIFTWTLLQGLEGRSDLNGDGYITATELANYVGPTVSSLSKQTPIFGSLVGSEGGEFIFELKHENEFLSDVTHQLDGEAIQLNAELDRVRAEIAAKKSRNEQLRRELAKAKAELAGSGGISQAANAAQRNDRGTALFREKKYEEALKEFQEAVKLSPSSALAANNLGFTHFRLGRHAEAVQWFEKALALDPARAIAYANLGDAYLALGRNDEARKAFEKYLELAPTSRYADEVRRKLAALN